MGALHAGHAALLRRARAENDAVVATIFVNPAQFGPGEDYSRYPRRTREDHRLCREEGVDVLFTPSAESLYPAGFQTWVTVEDLSRPLCGAFRPGHFRGVATVVLKLFNLVQPTRAYFGRKDYQQLKVIERMARDLDVPVEVVAVETVRDADGLALSSRNAYLSPAERAAAGGLPRALERAAMVLRATGSARRAAAEGTRVLDRIPGGRTQYMEIRDAETLAPLAAGSRRAVAAAAVRMGGTRLIDNKVITLKSKVSCIYSGPFYPLPP
jgi:pantoate--beta-alanine ligase